LSSCTFFAAAIGLLFCGNTAPGAAASGCVAPPAGLVAWWTGDGDANDIVGDHHGSLYNGASFAAGKVGLGFALDGDDDFVLIPDSDSLDFSTELTVEMWFKSEYWGGPESRTLIDKRTWTSCNYGAIVSEDWGFQLYCQPENSSYNISQYYPLPSLNEFHHFAGTFRQLPDHQIELKTYLDGQLAKTQVFPGDLASTRNEMALCIGAARGGVSENFQGVIDEVSLYNRVLAAEEVRAIFDADDAGKCKNIAPRPPQILRQPQSATVFAGEMATFSVLAGGSNPLHYQWKLNENEIAGANSPAFTITSAQETNAGGYSVVITNEAGTITSETATLIVNTNFPECVPAPVGIVSWWTGDGTADDLLGINHATLYNGATFAQGKVGLGFSLDGDDDYVLIPDSPSLGFSDQLTVELWFKSASWGGPESRTLIDKRTWTSCNFGAIVSEDWGFQLYYNDPSVFGGDHPGNMFEISAHFPLPTLNEFHHFAGTYRQLAGHQTELMTYLDGQLVETRTFAGDLASTRNDMAVCIGAARGGISENFKGIIDEVSLYGRALSLEEIQAIFNAGAAGKCKNITPSPPQILHSPESVALLAGETANFSVTAMGTPPLSYQWLFNGEPLADATTSSLAIPNVQEANAGSYAAVVGNTSGSVTSLTATLTVDTNLPVCVPAPAGLVAWWTGDGTADDLLGINNGQLHNGASFAQGKVGLGFALDGDDDFVLIEDSPSLNFSDALTVELWFKSEDWGGPESRTLIDKRTWTTCNFGAIVSEPWGFQVYNADASHGFQISAHFPLPSLGVFHHFASTYRQLEGQEIEVKTYLDGQEVDSRTFPGEMIDTMNDMAVCIGAARGGVSENFKGIIDEVSLYGRALSPEEIQSIYHAASAGKCKNITGVPPRILTQPQSLAVLAGESAGFSVTALGTPPLSYQWSFNDQPLSESVASSLVLPNAQVANAGSYVVVISNPSGSVTSLVATLAVDTNLPVCVPAPAGLVSRWSAEGTAADSVGSNHGQLKNGAGFAPGKVGLGFALDGVDDFVLVPDSETLRLTDEASFELWFKAASSHWGGLIDKRDDPWGCNYGLFMSEEYGVQLYYNDPNAFGGDYRFNTHEISAYFPLPSLNEFHHIAGTYRQVDAEHVELKTYIDGRLVRARIFGGNLANTLNNHPLAIGAASGVCCYFQGIIDEVALYNRTLTASEIWAIYRAGSQGKCEEEAPPRIAAQPRSTSVFVGSNAVLAVDAIGTQPLLYQWYFNGAVLDGATTARLEIPAAAPANAGGYFVTVSNHLGGVISVTAMLAVNTNLPPEAVPPSIATQPANTTVSEGSTVLFSVAANGSTPLFYQWHFNGDGIPGATQSTLILNNVQFSQAGDYSVRVSNSAGFVFSDPAALSVQPGTNPPVIVRQPASHNVAPDGSMAFSVSAAGASPLSYQWRLNGSDLPGATEDTLLIQNAQPGHAGVYSVLVSNPYGSVLSADAVLIVTNDPIGGLVFFSNHGTQFDAPVFDTDGTTRLSAPNYRAALFAGSTVAALAQVGPGVEFRSGDAAGYFAGGNRVIPTVEPGQSAYVQVRVWDNNIGSAYEETLQLGGKVGTSEILSVVTGGGGSPPGLPASLVGLQSFSLTQGLNFTAASATPVIIPVARLDTGAMEWVLKGRSGVRYAVECSANLVQWAAFTIVIPTNGEARFTDRVGLTCTYYRARLIE
jgi:Concanavalin A-like lectin/glucanases superfamily/Immunoglobulin domain/Immunoglobulin I-set domain